MDELSEEILELINDNKDELRYEFVAILREISIMENEDDLSDFTDDEIISMIVKSGVFDG